MPDAVHAVTLNCHPDTPSHAVRGIAVRVRREAGSKLAVTYVLEGDLEHVRVPPPGAPRFAGGLWRHTCCEIFIACEGSPGYYEFNLSPSGEWAAYAFDGYRALRAGDLDVTAPAPRIGVRGGGNELELDAVIRLDCLATLAPGAPLALGLSAVVEDSDGVLSYWALSHPPGKPDFHHPAAFAMSLKTAEA